MPHYEFREGAETDDWVDQGSRLLNLVVRVIGLVLLGTGFIVALLVISSAWSLYENPARIEAFALEVERGSNLDLTLSSAVSRGRSQVEDATAVSLPAAASSASRASCEGGSTARIPFACCIASSQRTSFGHSWAVMKPSRSISRRFSGALL